MESTAAEADRSSLLVRARIRQLAAAAGFLVASLAPLAAAGELPASSPRPSADGLRLLMTTPWREMIIALGVGFGVWLLYLFRNGLFSIFVKLADFLGRRSDGRTMVWMAGALGAGALVWGGIRLLDKATPEYQYFALTGGQLTLVIGVVLLVVAFITWATMRVFSLAARPAMNRRYELFIGWHFLTSQRTEHRGVAEYEGGRKPGTAMLVASGALIILAAAFGGRIPWRQWIGPLTPLVLPLRAGLGVFGFIVLTWPLRPTRATGSVDRLDRARARLHNLPSVLSVTPTTFISIVGVGVGVWALVVVLSVMAGFESDLRGKILATNPHVVIQDQEPMEGIPGIRPLLGKLRALDGVLAAIPYVQGEVILTSRENQNVALKLRGIDPEDLNASEHHLQQNMVSGAVDNLLAPERIVPSGRWALEGPADNGGDRSDEGEPTPDTEDIEPEPIGDAPAETGDPDDIEPEPIGQSRGGRTVKEEGIRPGILLGVELANSLRVDVGGEVTVISPRDGAGFLGIQPRARTFRVGGIFHTGMYEFDLKLAYVRMSEAQRFFHLGGDINRVELRLRDPDSSASILAAVRPMLTRESLETLDWKALNRNLFSALQLEKIVMFVVLGFIVLVASFNIIGSLVMIILDKAQEIGILKSMGATGGAVRRLFLVLGGLIGIIGSSAGLAVGLLTCWAIQTFGIQLPRQYYIEKLPVHVDTTTTALVFGAGILVCLLATLYPAGQAGKLGPVEALRYD